MTFAPKGMRAGGPVVAKAPPFVKKMSEKQDAKFDKKRGIKENSPADMKQDKKMGVAMKGGGRVGKRGC
jgi:hypothetical protein